LCLNFRNAKTDTQRPVAFCFASFRRDQTQAGFYEGGTKDDDWLEHALPYANTSTIDSAADQRLIHADPPGMRKEDVSVEIRDDAVITD
jgi:HSP20 family molecular chaperone IbpA